MRRRLKVLLLFDFPGPPPRDGDYASKLHPDDWICEQNILDALKSLGHEVRLLGLHDDIRPLTVEVRRRRPDIVFNLVEAFAGDRHHEANVAGLLELLRIPYTGSRAGCLALCRNKAFTKRILSPHRIKTPRSVVFPLRRRQGSLEGLKFPVLVKPLGMEASDGIAQASFAESAEACLDRVRFLHESLQTDALVEEFIGGREIYAGVIGNRRLRVLPLRELFFDKVPDERPKFATYKSKWNDAFRRKWGIREDFAAPLPEGMERRIARITRTAFRALQLSGYGRLDLRVTPEGEIYVLEVNPNPNLAKTDELAQAAQKARIPYRKLIQEILTYGLQLGSSRRNGK